MSEPKKLYRSRKDRMIAGVCGGLGKYFGIDPVLLRIVFVVLTFFRGSGVILYLILAIVVPNEPEEGKEGEKLKDSIRFKEGVVDLTEGAKKMSEEFVRGTEQLAEALSQPKEWLSQRRNVLGLFLILVGLIALTEQLFPGIFNWKVFWPLTLVLIGFYIILKG